MIKEERFLGLLADYKISYRMTHFPNNVFIDSGINVLVWIQNRDNINVSFFCLDIFFKEYNMSPEETKIFVKQMLNLKFGL